MSHLESTILCDGCGVEITWAPLVVGGCHYCCEDCQRGVVCACGEEAELEDERYSAHGKSLSADIL